MKTFLINKIIRPRSGFTVLEIIVSLTIFVISILLVGSIYSLSQKTYNTGSKQAELIQNARVSLDRLSRELRQSVAIATVLPASNINPATEILFQDGHDTSQITYLKYYLNNGNLMRKYSAYYFTASPSTYVVWNAVDEFGNPPSETIFDDRVVGEYFTSLGFWGSNGLINIIITLLNNQVTTEINTSVYSRNN